MGDTGWGRIFAPARPGRTKMRPFPMACRPVFAVEAGGGNQRQDPPSHHKLPFVDSTPLTRGSSETAWSKALASALKIDSRM